MITYDRLFETMAKKGISQYSLENDYGISRGMLDRLRNNQNVTIKTINILCNILECDVSDILEYNKDEVNTSC